MNLATAKEIVKQLCDSHGFFYLASLCQFAERIDVHEDKDKASEAVRRVLAEGYICYRKGRLYRRRLQHPHPYVVWYCQALRFSHLWDALSYAVARDEEFSATCLRKAIEDGYARLDGLVEPDYLS